MIRFNVEPIVVLPPEQAIPVFTDEVWNNLQETRGIEKGAKGWAKYYRGSLRRMSNEDGELLLGLLKEQQSVGTTFELTDRDRRQLQRGRKLRTSQGEVTVVVPRADDSEDDEEAAPPALELPIQDIRQSIQVQAMLANIGITMGFKVWIPRADKARVFGLLRPEARPALLDQLPLNYDEATLDTIEQIDVIWLRGRSMARAFEVEHTTAIYSGLLRMADLLALQPNMDIKLHIVAPEERRDKVFREMLRPVFALLDRGPLYKSCTFISYDGVEEIEKLEFLAHTNDSVLEEYESEAEA